MRLILEIFTVVVYDCHVAKDNIRQKTVIYNSRCTKLLTCYTSLPHFHRLSWHILVAFQSYIWNQVQNFPPSRMHHITRNVTGWIQTGFRLAIEVYSFWLTTKTISTMCNTGSSWGDYRSPVGSPGKGSVTPKRLDVMTISQSGEICITEDYMTSKIWMCQKALLQCFFIWQYLKSTVQNMDIRNLY